MAAMEKPELLGKCNCGEMLIKFSGQDPHWTKSPSIEMLFSKATEVKTVNCPGHGGDPRIMIGGAFHPRFMLEIPA